MPRLGPKQTLLAAGTVTTAAKVQKFAQLGEAIGFLIEMYGGNSANLITVTADAWSKDGLVAVTAGPALPAFDPTAAQVSNGTLAAPTIIKGRENSTATTYVQCMLPFLQLGFQAATGDVTGVTINFIPILPDHQRQFGAEINPRSTIY